MKVMKSSWFIVATSTTEDAKNKSATGATPPHLPHQPGNLDHIQKDFIVLNSTGISSVRRVTVAREVANRRGAVIMTRLKEPPTVQARAHGATSRGNITTGESVIATGEDALRPENLTF